MKTKFQVGDVVMASFKNAAKWEVLAVDDRRYFCIEIRKNGEYGREEDFLHQTLQFCELVSVLESPLRRVLNE